MVPELNGGGLWAFLAALLPAFVMMAYVFWYDKVHPEPIAMLFKGFVCGIVSTAIIFSLRRYFPAYFDWAYDGDSVLDLTKTAFFFAAIPEETVKLLMLWEWGSIAAIRAVLTVPGHYIYAVAMGYFYSIAKYRPQKGWRRLWQLSFIWTVPVILHGTYDAIAINEYHNDTVNIILTIGLFAFCYTLHKLCNRLIQKQLMADCEATNKKNKLA